jgi:hypothetical protein
MWASSLTQVAAAGALGRIALEDDDASLDIGASGAIERLTKALARAAAPPALHKAALCALLNLSHAQPNAAAMVRAGAVPHAVAFLGSADVRLQVRMPELGEGP